MGWYWVLAVVLGVATSGGASGAERSPTSSDAEFGSLKLCPAGGRAFMMAWNLACEMKRRRRKRASRSDGQVGTALVLKPSAAILTVKRMPSLKVQIHSYYREVIKTIWTALLAWG